MIIFLGILCGLLAIGFCVTLAWAYRCKRTGQEERQYAQTYDRPTGLGNRGKLKQDFAKLQTLDGYVLIDIYPVRFSEFYHLFGTELSDVTLRRFCKQLENFSVEQGGEAYRTAFKQAILLLRVEDKAVLMDKLRALLEQLEPLDIQKRESDYQYPFLLSFGAYFLSDAEDKGAPLEEILEHLDGATHQNVAGAANSNVMIEDGCKPNWALHQMLTEEAQGAWGRREFIPYCQPVFNLEDGNVVGGEILARWQHPTRGLLMPGQFIRLLEENGLIVDLDLYMLEEACKRISHWLENGILTVPLSINISQLNLHRVGFLDRLVSIVQRYDIPAVLLELEMSAENLRMSDNKAFSDQMNFLHEQGFSLSLDNFTQMDLSAMGLLAMLPIDSIKISYRFFADTAASPKANIYGRSFFTLARDMGINVVVEQIENKEQAELVKSLGGVSGTGFYFSKPLPSEEFQELIQ